MLTHAKHRHMPETSKVAIHLSASILMTVFSILDYMYHTSVAKASGELCLKYIFSFGAFARSPLLQRFENYTKTLSPKCRDYIRLITLHIPCSDSVCFLQFFDRLTILAVHLSGKCQPPSYTAIKIGWIIKGLNKHRSK